jgi:glycerate kinase
MLKALGFGMYGENGKEVENGAKGLKELARIDLDTADPILAECEFNIACDVTNPLCGDNGCSAIYGPQKGATPEMIREMDAYLEKYAELTKSVIPDADKNYPGCGAAGGIGFAFREYLGGALKSGISLILDATDAEKFIKDADIVITGEGRLDGQTAMGKAPVGVARLAKKHGKTVIAFSGCVTDDAVKCNEEGIDAFFPILDTVRTLDEALDKKTAHKNLSRTAEQAFRLIKACRK